MSLRIEKELTTHPLGKLGLPGNSLDKLQLLCDARTMRELDRNAIENIGIPGMVLMENAARSFTDLLEQEILSKNPEQMVVVCCGKGNNGGDGFAIARHHANRNYRVTVVHAGEAKTEDAFKNQQIWEQFGESVSFPSSDASRIINSADILVDSIFGTGLEREIGGAYREWVEIINDCNAASKWAVDIPSGVYSDDSRIRGQAVRCDYTVSMQYGKTGCFQFPGSSLSGKIFVPDISIPFDADCLKNPDHENHLGTWLSTPAFIKKLLPRRPLESHKGDFGHLFTVCGSSGMAGAAMLASMGALKNGTGLVTACVPSKLRDALPGQAPEIMTLSPPECLEKFEEKDSEFVIDRSHKGSATVLGCGLGIHSRTTEFVRTLCREITSPLLIDADGLNHLDPECLIERDSPTVITPHPKELSRLCGLSVSEIQESRIETVRALSREWNTVILLKGAYSVIGAPEGAVFINPFANPGLATAGSGDVLSGIIGGFLAQGLAPLQATLAGAYLHGSAAECLLQQEPSLILCASDLFRGIGMARYQLL